MLYFSANSGTSTVVSLPPAHPDDERGGADAGFPILYSDHDTGKNNDTPSSASTEQLNDLKAADDCSNAVVIGTESNSTEDSDGETSIVICEQVIQKKTIEVKSNGIPLLGTNDKKQRRKRRTVATPLETVSCRGACGGGSYCVSKGSDQVGYLHCENYERDSIKCPLWVGMACASKLNNFKCRICVLLDAPQALKR